MTYRYLGEVTQEDVDSFTQRFDAWLSDVAAAAKKYVDDTPLKFFMPDFDEINRRKQFQQTVMESNVPAAKRIFARIVAGETDLIQKLTKLMDGVLYELRDSGGPTLWSTFQEFIQEVKEKVESAAAKVADFAEQEAKQVAKGFGVGVAVLGAVVLGVLYLKLR